ncbi:MAG: hypothetical protein Ct9H300mP8_12970 [Gammaproteobacteria bacterium]|nr:MAG: hypothetical protein Ct9H300mP8_12970 [Gammaproteobacteria bacterium]
MLHMEIVQERLEREYGIELITSGPTVVYQVTTKQGETIQIDNPSQLPEPGNVAEMEEPIARANILVRRNTLEMSSPFVSSGVGYKRAWNFWRTSLANVHIPMSEVVMDFFDRLKSVSRGFASLDYGFDSFEVRPSALDILINGERVDALAVITHKDEAQTRGRKLVATMRELIPRQFFDVAIQAAIGGHVVSRQTVKALRKNVTAKCYGGMSPARRNYSKNKKPGKNG